MFEEIIVVAQYKRRFPRNAPRSNFATFQIHLSAHIKWDVKLVQAREALLKYYVSKEDQLASIEYGMKSKTCTSREPEPCS